MKTFFSLHMILCASLSCFSQKAALRFSEKEDSCRIRIHRLSLNSEYSDFSPMVRDNRFYFVSSADRQFAVKYEDARSLEGFTDIYTAQSEDSLRFKKIKSLNAINSKYNEGPFCISGTGKEIYFTSGGKKTPGKKLSIFKSSQTRSGWSKPEELSFCKSGYNFCHPSVSADGNLIFFSSDMPGGNGGMDLYVCIMEEKGWSKPVNLGKAINSSADELFPFVTPVNEIYFSSKRNGGAGGMDIYRANWNQPDKKAALLPWPINSTADDYGIWLDSTLENGYFSSNRIPEYKDDIFYFTTWIPDFDGTRKPAVKNKFCFTFYEESVAASSDTSNLSFEWNFGDGTKARGLKTRHCYTHPGNYNVQLNVVEKFSGEVFKNEASYVLNIEHPPQLLIDCRDTVFAGSEVLISSGKSALKGYEINKVYWSFGDGKYQSGPLVKHYYHKSGLYNLELLVEARNQDTRKKEKFKTEKQIIVR